MLVHQFLEGSAERQPEKLAVIHGNTRATYAEADQVANRFANELIAKGIPRGNRMAILLENSLSHITAYYVILKTGGITVPLFPSTTKEELTYTLSQCEAKAIICNDRPTDLLEKCLPKLKDLFIVTHKGRKTAFASGAQPE